MVSRTLIAGIFTIAAALPVTPADSGLKSATLASFDRYVQLTESRIGKELAGQSPLLWINRLPQADKTVALSQLAQGRVISERMETRDAGKAIDPPGGLIHHWIGTVLLPGVHLSQAREFVQNYDRYADVFSPMVVRSKLLSRSGDTYVFSMRTSVERVVTVVIDADYRVEYRALGPDRLYTRSIATNIQEVRSAGNAAETRVPGDQSSGYLWRLNTYCSFEESSLGTIEQCESISLTRGIPFGLGWLVGPFVNSIPKDTLEFTLGKVRAGAGSGW